MASTPIVRDVEIHVEAASVVGRPVYFQIYEPWSEKTLLPRPDARGIMVSRILMFGGRLPSRDRRTAARTA